MKRIIIILFVALAMSCENGTSGDSNGKIALITSTGAEVFSKAPEGIMEELYLDDTIKNNGIKIIEGYSKLSSIKGDDYKAIIIVNANRNVGDGLDPKITDFIDGFSSKQKIIVFCAYKSNSVDSRYYIYEPSSISASGVDVVASTSNYKSPIFSTVYNQLLTLTKARL